MLKDKLNKDAVQALKNKDELRLGTLRLLSAAIHNLEIEKRTKSGTSDLTDEEITDLLRREARKRKEAIELYKKGERRELAAKEEAELKIVGEYLPPELGVEEIKKAVVAALAKVGSDVKGPQDFGRVMSEAMKILKGRADANLVSELVKKALAGE